MEKIGSQSLLQKVTYFKRIASYLSEKKNPLNKQETWDLVRSLDAMSAWLISHGLQTTHTLLGFIKDKMGKVSDAEFQTYLGQAHAALGAEIHSHLFLYLDQTKRDYYDAFEPFGPKVAKKFPLASFDISEAASCYALERDTACVFHCMRALEEGLRDMASALGVPPLTDENWQNVIDRMEAKIKALNGGGVTPARGWKIKSQYYSEAATNFRFFKDAWRNYVMHKSVKYTTQEAKRIYDNVETFMQQLAKPMKKIK